MFLNFTAIFDEDCNKELSSRLDGKNDYGQPTVHGISMCKQEQIVVTNSWSLSRDRASLIVVWIDVSIILIFVLAIYRLKFYEELTNVDLRNGQMKVEDFSLMFDGIPINEEDYNSNPELLTAMMATHIEDIC
jgi:hypothetical protein